MYSVVSSTCQMLSKKATNSDKVLWWCGVASILIVHTDIVIVRCNVTAVRYIEQILLQHVLIAAYGVGPEFIHIHDNARAHVACITRAVFKNWTFNRWKGQQ